MRPEAAFEQVVWYLIQSQTVQRRGTTTVPRLSWMFYALGFPNHAQLFCFEIDGDHVCAVFYFVCAKRLQVFDFITALIGPNRHKAAVSFHESSRQFHPDVVVLTGF